MARVYAYASPRNNRAHLPACATISRHRPRLPEVWLRGPGAPAASAQLAWTADPASARGTGRDSSAFSAGKTPARLRGTRPDVHQNGADPLHAPQSPAGWI